MQRSTSALTLLSAASLTCGFILTPAVPALAHEEHGTASASDTTGDQRTRRIDGENTIAGVHANLVDLSLRDGALTLGSRASTHDGEGIYDPARTVFHLPNTDSTRSTVAAGYEFIATKGTPIWYIPHTGTGGVLHPGFGADNIPRDALKENKISLELVRTQTPDGGSVEVFHEDPSGPTRLFSSRENLPAHTITAGDQAHPGWAFTAPGVYRLTFRATAQRADGTPISAEQTYTVAVGDVPANIFEQMRTQEGEGRGGAPKAADRSAAASGTSPAGAGAPKTPANISGANAHNVREAGAPASGGSNGASQQPRAESPAAQGPAPEPQAQQAGNSASQESGADDRSTPEAVNAAEPSGGNGAAGAAASGGT
ncbi:MAG: ABC transporter permease, partial [Rothia dentocariosa]|nr:ABC transporter permease [Rothia dentocariosa]